MSRIVHFYCLSYPDNLPEDPDDAGSETYVELKVNGLPEVDFDDTYSLFVCTPRFLLRRVAESGNAILLGAVLVVPVFDRHVIHDALNRFIDQIPEVAERKG